MTRSSVLVTAANGRIGRRVVQQLAHVGTPVRALVRNLENARKFFSSDVDIVQGDLAEVESLKQAMSEVDRVLLISPVDPDQVRLQGNVVETAIETGAGIVKLSGLATFPDSYVDSGRWHAETEGVISASGLPYVFLHPLFFMQNLAFAVDQALKTGTINSGVGDASISMIHADDIAAVATRSLLELDSLNGQTLELTAESSHSYDDIAGILSVQFGRRIEYQSLDEHTLAGRLRAAGHEDWHQQLLLQFNRAFREGLGDKPSTIVMDTIGRPAKSLTHYLTNEIQHTGSGDSNPFPS